MSCDPSNDLIRAVRDGDLCKVKTLIDTFGLSYSKSWSEGYILLRDAAQKGHREVVKLLLMYGSKVNSNNISTDNTPLHYAVDKNYPEMVEMLLDRYSNVNATNSHGETPLLRAVRSRQGNVKIVDSLLKRMAHVDARSKEDGMTPLHYVAQSGNVQIAECLLNHGACVNSAFHSSMKAGYTPLHFASERDNEKLVELLLRKGADINASTSAKYTVLHFAAKNNRHEIVKVLLKNGGYDVNALDNNGKTVLYVAIESGNLSTVKHILELCPEINNQNNRGCIHAALHGQDSEICRRVIETLVGYGITVNAEDAKVTVCCLRERLFTNFEKSP